MAQRIVRGKAKIREAGIPFTIPGINDLPERLDSVLQVVYLIFNEGYSASAGEIPIRRALSEEAIRLARLILSLLPEPEIKGLLALMLLHSSRRETRIDSDGKIVLLPDQDRTRWDNEMIREGELLLREALESDQVGAYSLQAAISAVHARATTAAETDWPEILALYDLLLKVQPGPVVQLNRAVAVSKVHGAAEALAIVEGILKKGHLQDYPAAQIARGDWLVQLGRLEDGREAWNEGLSLSRSLSEQEFIREKISNLSI